MVLLSARLSSREHPAAVRLVVLVPIKNDKHLSNEQREQLYGLTKKNRTRDLDKRDTKLHFLDKHVAGANNANTNGCLPYQIAKAGFACRQFCIQALQVFLRQP
jgi:hypothetical protein